MAVVDVIGVVVAVVTREALAVVGYGINPLLLTSLSVLDCPFQSWSLLSSSLDSGNKETVLI